MSDGLTLAVRVTPRSSREAIEVVDAEGTIHLRVTAPPADGAANAAVVRLVAKALGVPRGAVSLTGGAASRHKRLRVEGTTREAVERHFPGARVSG